MVFFLLKIFEMNSKGLQFYTDLSSFYSFNAILWRLGKVAQHLNYSYY